MCTIFRDTREVDESIEVIQLIYPRIMSLRPKIAEFAESDDLDTYKGITRLYAEAGEAWVVMIARLPTEFRGLVEAILECCARDRDRESISLTFLFWYEFKQMITLENYKEAQDQYTDVFAKLVDIMIKHLEFPIAEGSDETDLFDGDREQEEKFREFRHQMGDVLKDCCDVITVTACLGKAFDLIQRWRSTWGFQSTGVSVPHWQELEAPLFSMRAMGRNVSSEENVVLHQVIPLIVQIPDHEKLRFQAIMALGRYTDWTAQHPEFLQPQLNFVIAGFQHDSKEVVRAAALAFKFFGTDCRKLLQDHVSQLHDFYESVLDKLPPASQEEITEGVASVVSVQPVNKIYDTLKLYCDPIMKRLIARASEAKNEQHDEGKLAVAGVFRSPDAYYSSNTNNSSIRLFATSDGFYTKRSALRLTFTTQPGSEVLPRNFTCDVCNSREFHYLYTNPRKNMPLLAIYGTFVPNSDTSFASDPSSAARFWLRKFKTRMLSMGHRFCATRICSWGRIR